MPLAPDASAAEPNEREPRWGLALAVAATFLTLVVVWAFPYLPATDLPQHEAQVALWLRLDPALYELQLFTPYLLTTGLARLFATVLAPTEAVRLVLTLGLLGLPAATWTLLRRTGGDPWWALAAFPLGFGFAFRWGFLSYLCALPLVLLLVAVAWELRERDPAEPAKGRLVALGLLGLALFFTHAIAWGAGVLAAGAVLLAPQPGRSAKARLLRTAPLLLTAPIALGWVVHTAGRSSAAFLVGADPSSATVWALSPLRVWTVVSEHLLGGGLDSACAAFALLLALGAGAERVEREPARWLPGAILLGLALLAPWRLLGTSHVNGRFAVLAVLLLLIALVPREASPQRQRSRGALAVVVLTWPLALLVEVQAFNRDHGETLDQVAAVVRPGERVYGWALVPQLPPRIGDPLLHLPVRLTATAHVTVEPSFARSFAPAVVYRPGAVQPLNEANPVKEINAGGYDVVLVHVGPLPDADDLLRGWYRVAEAGPWRAYRRAPR